MKYTFSEDLIKYRKLENLTQEELSNKTGISRVTIARAEAKLYEPSRVTMEIFYSYLYDNGFKINEVVSQLLDDNKGKRSIFFHGSKGEIEGPIDIKHSLEGKDFGNGFYMGETYLNAACWALNRNDSNVYAIYFDNEQKLKSHIFGVDLDWMIAILAYRGCIDQYLNNEKVKKVLDMVENCDYIIAPIADNMMYDILNEFASGSITDEQCLHCLSANQLGKQIVFLNDNACSHLKIVKKFFLSKSERKDLANIKEENNRLGMQKVSLVKQEYRRKGKYIDELFR